MVQNGHNGLGVMHSCVPLCPNTLLGMQVEG